MQVKLKGDPSGQYLFDGLDWYTGYRYMVADDSTAADDILAYAESKEVYSHDWKGENGRQYDLTVRKFQDRQVTFSGYLLADTKIDFWNKYHAFWAKLKSPGPKTLKCIELEQTVNVFYVKSSGTKRFTKLLGFPDKIAVKMDLTFTVMYGELVNPPGQPQVYAGADKFITGTQVAITDATITLAGGATVASLEWTYVASSPSGQGAGIDFGNTITPTMYGMTTPGAEYFFKLRVLDSNGLVAEDFMTIKKAGLTYYGFSAVAPTTSAAVKALPQSGATQVGVYSLTTGTNRIMSFAVPATYNISVYDAEADEDLTAQYIGTPLVIDGINYTVYTLQNLLPYSTSRTHTITTSLI